MLKILFDSYLKQGKIDKLVDLNSKEMDAVWENDTLSLENKVFVTLQNHQYHYLNSASDDELYTSFFHLLSQGKIDYSHLSVFVDQEKRYDLVARLIPLNSFEDVFWSRKFDRECALFSLLKLVSLKEQMSHQKDDKLLKDYQEYFHFFAKNNVGIEQLTLENNVYFMEHVRDFMNATFFSTSRLNDDDFLYFLYQHGFQKEIRKNLNSMNLMDLNCFFAHGEIKHELFSRTVAMKCNRLYPLFLNLSYDQKPLLAYYECDWFSHIQFQHDYADFQLDGNQRTLALVREIYENNFGMLLSSDIQERLIGLYGRVSEDVIEFAIQQSLELQEDFWHQVDEISKIYFDGNSFAALKFWSMYPDFIAILSKPSHFTLHELKQQIRLLQKTVTLNVKSITDRLEDAKYAIEDVNGKVPSWISLVDHQTIAPLFSYSREIVTVNIQGEMQEFEASDSHESTLKEIYPGFGTDMQEVLYQACMQGDILLVIENGGIQFWMPPTMTTLQRRAVEQMIVSWEERKLESSIHIGCSYALPHNHLEFISLNGSDVMTLDAFQKSLGYFLIDDDCQYLYKSPRK